MSSSLQIFTFMEFLLALGSIISLAASYSLLNGVLSFEFFSYFTRSAYRRVFIVFSAEVTFGDTFPIITVLQNPTNESFNTMVSLLPLKGVWPFPWSKARIHYFNANNDLLIYAPSILVCLFWSMWSAPRSLPARSINDILVNCFLPSFTTICSIAWERDESAFVAFWDVTLKLLPYSITSRNSSAEQIYFYSMPITLILLFLSSMILSSLRLFKRSKSLPQ